MKINILRGTIIVPLAFISLTGLGFFAGLNLQKLETIYNSKTQANRASNAEKQVADITAQVTPAGGFTLPISWGDFGPSLIAYGVIDESKFEKAVTLTNDQKTILDNGASNDMVINSQNAQFVVDYLWAIGLAQKSIVYTDGPMGTQYKGQQGNFASTGGWTLAKGDATNYLNKFDLMNLTPDQQKKVEEISQNVYRPCCDNPTWFPDCNHGMAALAAIEMMVAKGIPDDEIYKSLLELNSFWFPQNYVTTAVYFARQGVTWDKIDAKKVLGKDFSSASGSTKISQEVGPLPGQNSGGSCGA